MPHGKPFLNYNRWPTVDDLNRFKPQGTCTWIGAPIQFVPQKKGRRSKTSFDSLYELKIFLSAEVNTRSENWHDFFNAMIWYSFPKTKSALNMRQFIAFDENTPFPWISAQKARMPEQDKMTMFDEGGCIVAEVGAQKIPYLFGHALYEALFFGKKDLSALAMNISFHKDFLSQKQEDQLALIDAKVSQKLSNRSSYHEKDLFYPFRIN